MLVSFVKDHKQTFLFDIKKSKILGQFNKYYMQYNMSSDLKNLYNNLDKTKPINLKYIYQGLNIVLTYTNDQW